MSAVRLALSLGLLSACGGPAAPPTDPDDPLAALEAGLLSGPHGVDLAITAEGAVDAELRGALAWDEDALRLDLSGTFAGDEVSPWLLHDGDGTRGGRAVGAADFERAAMPALREAMVLGFSRMGALHNAARLVGGEPPDHAEGGVRDWVRAEDLVDGGRRLDYRLVVDGQPSGEASLFLNENGQPTRRELTVHFDDGDMRVVEQYAWRDQAL